jgi:hypothetical protein
MMPKQNEDRDIQSTAQDLIARYADEAELIAAGHADTMLDQGNMGAFEIWRKVMAAVRSLQAKDQPAR